MATPERRERTSGDGRQRGLARGDPDRQTLPGMGEIWFITGTDTGVGKTVFTVLLTRYLRSTGVSVRAVKPLCSGGREDA